MEDDQSLDEVNATISNNDQHHHFHLPSYPDAPSQHTPKSYYEDHKPVIISTHELPAPYGCR